MTAIVSIAPAFCGVRAGSYQVLSSHPTHLLIFATSSDLVLSSSVSACDGILLSFSRPQRNMLKVSSLRFGPDPLRTDLDYIKQAVINSPDPFQTDLDYMYAKPGEETN